MNSSCAFHDTHAVTRQRIRREVASAAPLWVANSWSLMFAFDRIRDGTDTHFGGTLET